MTMIDRTRDGSKAFFFDLNEIEMTNLGERALTFPEDERPRYLETFGGSAIDLKRIIYSKSLTVSWARIAPGGEVKRHSHGTGQLSYVLAGELHYGNRVVGPGMGRFGPDVKYAWVAGPEGAEMLEIHDGIPTYKYG